MNSTSVLQRQIYVCITVWCVEKHVVWVVRPHAKSARVRVIWAVCACKGKRDYVLYHQISLRVDEKHCWQIDGLTPIVIDVSGRWFKHRLTQTRHHRPC